MIGCFITLEIFEKKTFCLRRDEINHYEIKTQLNKQTNWYIHTVLVMEMESVSFSYVSN